jgi:four helix bundle protein
LRTENPETLKPVKGEKPQRVGSELEARTLRFAAAVLHFAETLPGTTVARVLTSQMVRSATAIGSNYRESNRAESKADFVHKVAIALKEAAETEYWLELCLATSLGDARAAGDLRQEANELIAILTTIRHRASHPA